MVFYKDAHEGRAKRLCSRWFVDRRLCCLFFFAMLTELFAYGCLAGLNAVRCAYGSLLSVSASFTRPSPNTSAAFVCACASLCVWCVLARTFVLRPSSDSYKYARSVHALELLLCACTSKTPPIN